MSAQDSFEMYRFAFAALAVMTASELVVGEPSPVGQCLILRDQAAVVLAFVSRRTASVFGHGVHYWQRAE